MDTRLHWGKWVENRMVYLGMRSQRTFAMHIGCSQNQVCRWFHMEIPPRRMRRGFDKALWVALRTDPFTLFSQYRNVAPDGAPLIDEPKPRRHAPAAA